MNSLVYSFSAYIHTRLGSYLILLDNDAGHDDTHIHTESLRACTVMAFAKWR